LAFFILIQNSQYGIMMEALRTNLKEKTQIHFYIQWPFLMTHSGWHRTNLSCAKRTNTITLQLVKYDIINELLNMIDTRKINSRFQTFIFLPGDKKNYYL